ncbi:MAG TPA: carboxypeptidase-like regulatory domain-containing protein, partial [Pyrinomonadaceae bacterium]|nr:carboxypeptidase-like regulatory domain-containing protein [Pyrinomonadaceae bacterium]
TMTITNSTISGNRGGIHSIADGTETLINTIVANNTAGGTSPDIFGIIETASHNLIGDAASSGGIVNGVSGNIVGVNPLIGPLQNNGGPTLTHALLPGSPAINAGNNCVLIVNGCGDGNLALPTDQRSLGRVGVVDIGAFELQAEPPATNVSVSGRVIASNGRGLANVTVTLTDTSGNRRSAQTNPFGFYQFTDVAAPGTCTLTAISRRYQFDPQVISVNGDVTDVNFVAQAP